MLYNTRSLRASVATISCPFPLSMRETEAGYLERLLKKDGADCMGTAFFFQSPLVSLGNTWARGTSESLCAPQGSRGHRMDVDASEGKGVPGQCAPVSCSVNSDGFQTHPLNLTLSPALSAEKKSGLSYIPSLPPSALPYSPPPSLPFLLISILLFLLSLALPIYPFLPLLQLVFGVLQMPQ